MIFKMIINSFQSHCDNILEIVKGDGVTKKNLEQLHSLEKCEKSMWPNRPLGSGGLYPS